MKEEGKPNIILIVMDTTRVDHLSCYGYGRQTTPHVDAIAAEGVIYENAIAPSSWTLPSHASLFTGLFPSQHDAVSYDRSLSPQFLTLAEVLRSHGYQTVGFSNNSWVGKAFGLSKGFDSFIQIWEVIQENRFPRAAVLINSVYHRLFYRHGYGARYQQRYDCGARRINRKIREWFARQYDPEAPFFMFVNYLEPHLRYDAPGHYKFMFLPETVKPGRAKKVNQDAWKYLAGKVEMTEEDFQILEALYDGEIAYLDHRMGELFAFLREQDILDDTILIITADHGENIGHHGLMDHQFSVYDSVAHVPLIIRYPKLFPPGKRVKNQAQIHQIYATLMNILGAQGGSEGDELSRRSLIPSEVERDPIPFSIIEYNEPYLRGFKRRFPDFDFSIYDRTLRAIRTKQYKYIRSSDGRDELYNLAEDPEEINNLIHREKGIAKELRAQLEDWLDSVSGPRYTGEAPKLDKATWQRLRELGYID